MLLGTTARILLKESASRSQILLSSDQRLGWKRLLQLKNLETVTSQQCYILNYWYHSMVRRNSLQAILLPWFL